MKRMIEAYQKITAPEGLAKRIEAQVQAEAKAKTARGMQGWFFGWMPKAAVCAAAMVCVAAFAVGIGKWSGDLWSSKDRTDGLPGIRLAMEDGHELSDTPVIADVLPEDSPRLQTASWIEGDDRVMVFLVTGEQPVAFSADSKCLSLYDEEKEMFTDCRRELMISTAGTFCVLLPVMGDDEVFYIQMSSAGNTCWIAIVYEQDAKEYQAVLQNKKR